MDNKQDVAVLVYEDKEHTTVGVVGSLEYYDKKRKAWMVEMPDGKLVEAPEAQISV